MTDSLVANTRAAAASIGQQVEVLVATTSRDIDTAFASLAQQPVGALLVSPDTFFDNRRAQFVTLAARHAVPAIYPFREYVQAGGLMSYVRALSTPRAWLVCIPLAFSRGRNRPSCRFCGQRSSSLWSTFKRPR
jgi:hypothetical protein